tara:strand:- start:140 stop:628 length:489 start_codon:yes stop_codon:yes gene_type:complete
MTPGKIYRVTWQDDHERREYLSALARRYAELPEIRRAALRALRSAAVDGTDREQTAQAIFYFVRGAVPYRLEYGEQIETPGHILRDPSLGADCDGHSLLVASLLSSVGVPARLAFWADPGGADIHVSAQALTRRGWVNLDTTQRQAPGWTPPGMRAVFTEQI